jgi:hypothetical protein
VTVDAAWEYTYRADFPGARLLWDREDILAGFRALPSPAPAMRLTRHDMIAAREQ